MRSGCNNQPKITGATPPYMDNILMYSVQNLSNISFTEWGKIYALSLNLVM